MSFLIADAGSDLLFNWNVNERMLKFPFYSWLSVWKYLHAWLYAFACSGPPQMGCWGMATWAYLAYRWGLTQCSLLRASLLTATHWSMRGSLTCRQGGSLVESLFHRWVGWGLLQDKTGIVDSDFLSWIDNCVCVCWHWALFKSYYVKPADMKHNLFYAISNIP